MISRQTAASIVTLLERALDDLLAADTLVAGVPPEHLVAQQIQTLWTTSANTAGMLAVIDEAYPDLAGPDVPFRGPSVQDTTGGGGEVDIEAVRRRLQHALSLLEDAAGVVDLSQEDNLTVKVRFQSRFAESLEALRSVVERFRLLQSGS